MSKLSAHLAGPAGWLAAPWPSSAHQPSQPLAQGQGATGLWLRACRACQVKLIAARLPAPNTCMVPFAQLLVFSKKASDEEALSEPWRTRAQLSKSARSG